MLWNTAHGAYTAYGLAVHLHKNVYLCTSREAYTISMHTIFRCNLCFPSHSSCGFRFFKFWFSGSVENVIHCELDGLRAHLLVKCSVRSWCDAQAFTPNSVSAILIFEILINLLRLLVSFGRSMHASGCLFRSLSLPFLAVIVLSLWLFYWCVIAIGTNLRSSSVDFLFRI